MNHAADLTLRNAEIFASGMDSCSGSSVAIKGNHILAVGSDDDIAALTGTQTKVIDCDGMFLMPGFHDAHCHTMALASSLNKLDCGRRNARSIVAVKKLIWEACRDTEPGRWIQAFGYDEGVLEEQRHPTRYDLDEVAPLNPVRLEHRTGHALVLNSLALTSLDIDNNFIESSSGTMIRDPETGDPSGLFIDMNARISSMMVKCRNDEEFIEGVTKANKLLLSNGVTSIQDAGMENGVERWATFEKLKERDLLTPRIIMMVGLRSSNDERIDAQRFCYKGEDLRIGATKIMLTSTTGSLYPSTNELDEIVMSMHRKGRQLAIHAVESEAVMAAANAISRAQSIHPRYDPRHRIEHCSECPPEVLKEVKASGAMVVTQPGFIYQNGAKYLKQVPGSLIPHLYPLASLSRAGIVWAGSTDTPVSAINIAHAMYASSTRKTEDGQTLGVEQKVSIAESLTAWTQSSAYSCFRERQLGSVKSGQLADIILLKEDPRSMESENLKNVEVMMTLVGGRVVWMGQS